MDDQRPEQVSIEAKELELDSEKQYGIVVPRRLAVRFELAVLFLFLVGLRIGDYFLYPGTSYSILDYIFVSFGIPLYLASFDLVEVLILIFVIFASGDDFSMVGLKRPRIADAAWLAFALVASMGITFLVYWVLFPGEGWSLEEWLRPSWRERPLPTTLGTTGLLFNAFAQEFVYRGYFLARFSEITKSIHFGSLLSSMSFAAVHLYQGSAGILSAFLLGMLFCFIVVRTRSLWSITFAHFLVNAYFYGLFG